MRNFLFFLFLVFAQVCLGTGGRFTYAMTSRDLYTLLFASLLSGAESYSPQGLAPPLQGLSALKGFQPDLSQELVPRVAHPNAELFARSEREIQDLIRKFQNNSEQESRIELLKTVDLTSHAKAYSGVIHGVPRKVFFLDFPVIDTASAVTQETLDRLSACCLRTGLSRSPEDSQKVCHSIVYTYCLAQSLLKQTQDLDESVSRSLVNDLVILGFVAYSAYDFAQAGILDFSRGDWIRGCTEFVLSNALLLGFRMYLSGFGDPKYNEYLGWVHLDKTKDFKKYLEFKKTLFDNRMILPSLDTSKMGSAFTLNRRYNPDRIKNALANRDTVDVFKRNNKLDQLLILVHPKDREQTIKKFLEETQFEEIGLDD